MTRRYQLIGQTESLAVHIVNESARPKRVEVVWRAWNDAATCKPLPAWVREIEATEYRTYAEAKSAAERVLAADFAA